LIINIIAIRSRAIFFHARDHIGDFFKTGAGFWAPFAEVIVFELFGEADWSVLDIAGWNAEMPFGSSPLEVSGLCSIEAISVGIR